MEYETITPKEFAERAARGERVRLIDVREAWEVQLVGIEDAEVMPLSRMAEWEGTLKEDEEMVFMCHHGVRSAHVCAYLARKGFMKLHNLAGGIDRWASEVDPKMQRY
jgi:adenylyltransferase/sulfurtransferase